MRPTQPLTTSQQFFFDNAAWSYQPATETQAEGRTRCAIALDAAEGLFMAAAMVSEVGIEWAHDEDGAADADPDNGPFQTCELALIWHRTDAGAVHYLASLGAIWDADATYRRVVRAELAMDCAERLNEIVRGVRHPA